MFGGGTVVTTASLHDTITETRLEKVHNKIPCHLVRCRVLLNSKRQRIFANVKTNRFFIINFFPHQLQVFPDRPSHAHTSIKLFTFKPKVLPSYQTVVFGFSYVCLDWSKCLFLFSLERRVYRNSGSRYSSHVLLDTSFCPSVWVWSL